MKMDSGKLLTVAVAAVGLIGTILSSKKEDAAIKSMKADLKKELLDEISKSTK